MCAILTHRLWALVHGQWAYNMSDVILSFTICDQHLTLCTFALLSLTYGLNKGNLKEYQRKHRNLQTWTSQSSLKTSLQAFGTNIKSAHPAPRKYPERTNGSD